MVGAIASNLLQKQFPSICSVRVTFTLQGSMKRNTSNQEHCLGRMFMCAPSALTQLSSMLRQQRMSEACICQYVTPAICVVTGPIGLWISLATLRRKMLVRKQIGMYLYLTCPLFPSNRKLKMRISLVNVKFQV